MKKEDHFKRIFMNSKMLRVIRCLSTSQNLIRKAKKWKKPAPSKALPATVKHASVEHLPGYIIQRNVTGIGLFLRPYQIELTHFEAPTVFE